MAVLRFQRRLVDRAASLGFGEVCCIVPNSSTQFACPLPFFMAKAYSLLLMYSLKEERYHA